MMKPRHNHKHSGFTLVEVMLAMTVFAFLITLAYGGVTNLLNHNKRTDKAQQNLQELQFAMVLMQQDIGQIANRPARDLYGENQPPLVSRQGNDKAIEFTRGGWPNPAGLDRSSLLRTAWAVEDESLIRYYWKELDLSTTSEPVKIAVLNDIESMTLRFLDQKNEWKQQWPAQDFSQPDEKPQPLPKAVEITLDTKRWGELKRLIPLVNSSELKADDIEPPPQNNNNNNNNNGG